MSENQLIIFCHCQDDQPLTGQTRAGQTHLNFSLPIAQSRSDDTLLTVDVIYGQNGKHGFLSKSRMERYFTEFIGRHCVTLHGTYCFVTIDILTLTRI